MRWQHTFCLAASLAAGACGDDPSSSGTQSFTVSITQPSRQPSAPDAGLILVLDGSGIRNVRAAGEVSVFSRDADGDRVAVAVLGVIADGPLVVFDAPADRSADDYEVHVQQAAAPDYGLRADVDEYAVDLTPR